VHYGPLDRRMRARSSFARRWWQASSTPRAIFAHNQRVVREIRELEHRARRLDVLVDDELIFAFYDRLVPADVTTGPSSRSGGRGRTRAAKLLFLVRMS